MSDPGADSVPESDWLYELLADVQLEEFFDKIRQLQVSFLLKIGPLPHIPIHNGHSGMVP